MFDWVHQLAALRSTNLALACGAEQILKTAPNEIIYARYGSSGCSGLTAHGTDVRPMLVVLERATLTPLQIDLHATAVAGCHPGKPSMGEATLSVKDGNLTIAPTTSFVVLPCD